jgi:hypothetical protein
LHKREEERIIELLSIIKINYIDEWKYNENILYYMLKKSINEKLEERTLDVFTLKK